MKNTFSLRKLALESMSRADEVVPVMMIDLGDIVPDPNQPRQTFSDELLKELAASMALHGQQIPITVRENPDGVPPFVIKDGERRWRAANLRPDEIPQLKAIKESSIEDARTLKIRQFIINDKSEGMTFEDQARLFKELLEDGKTKVEDIAVALSISPNRIYKVIQAQGADGLAGVARESGLTRDPETLNAIAALEKRDPASAAQLIEKGKSTGKISRKEVKEKAALSKAGRQKPDSIADHPASEQQHDGNTQTLPPRQVSVSKPSAAEPIEAGKGVPIIYVRFEGTDPSDATLFARREKDDGAPYLCLTLRHQEEGHAYVAFGSDNVVEPFRLDSLRLDRIVIPI